MVDEHNQRIVEYYDSSERAYEKVWSLGKTAGIHFGFWLPHETGFFAALSTPRLERAIRRQTDTMAEWVGLQPDDHVLDCGCGIGGTCARLTTRFGCQATGITLSPRQVERSQAIRQKLPANAASRFAVQLGDYTAIPFPDASFSVVWGEESICYAKNKADFIREAFRVLQPGGRIIVADGFATQDEYTGNNQQLMTTWLSGWAVDKLATPEGFTTDLQRHGFEDIQVIDVTERVLPSSLRLYIYALGTPFFNPLGKLLGMDFGVNTELQYANARGAKAQYLAIRKGLWRYMVIMAKKPN